MRIFVALIARHIQQRKHAGLELSLLLAECLFARFDLRIGDLFNLFKHFGRAHTLRQFCDDKLPLPARHLFNLPACANLERATACFVSLRNVFHWADDLPAVGKIRPRHEREKLFIAELGILDERDRGLRNFMQIVAWNLCSQANRNATGAIEQIKGQACGKQARLNF